ncbi:putative metal-binding motif-containing protein [Nanoarchaeota archaeon]
MKRFIIIFLALFLIGCSCVVEKPIVTYYQDADNDRYPDFAKTSPDEIPPYKDSPDLILEQDCDDNNPNIFPGQAETFELCFNNLDDDCDSFIDKDDSECADYCEANEDCELMFNNAYICNNFRCEYFCGSKLTDSRRECNTPFDGRDLTPGRNECLNYIKSGNIPAAGIMQDPVCIFPSCTCVPEKTVPRLFESLEAIRFNPELTNPYTGAVFEYNQINETVPKNGNIKVNQTNLTRYCSFNANALIQVVQGPFADVDHFSSLKLYEKVDNGEAIQHLQTVKGRYSVVTGALPNNEISIKGKSTYSEDVPMKLVLTLEEDGKERIIYISDSVPVKLAGECNQENDVNILLDTTHGIPEVPFTFNEKGKWKMNLFFEAPDGKRTLLSTLNGETVETNSMEVSVIPFVIDSSNNAVLKKGAETTALDLYKYITDYFPISPFNINSYHNDVVKSNLQLTPFSRATGNLSQVAIRNEVAITNQFVQIANMLNMNKIIVVMDPDDWKSYLEEMYNFRIIGLATNEKVIIAENPISVFVSMHELAHTLHFVWSDNEMINDCGINYHNQNPPLYLADGIQTSFEGQPIRYRYDQFSDIMTITQDSKMNLCTYYHVLNVLKEKIKDPRVILISGLVSKDGSGELHSSYQLDGEIDEGEGNWKIQKKDKDGTVLGTQSFKPIYNIHADGPRGTLEIEKETTGFVIRVLDQEGVSQIDLVNPDGEVVDSLYYNDPPEFQVYQESGDDTYLYWEGYGEYVYTIMAYKDGHWELIDFETEATEAVIHGDYEIIKIIASDGTQNTDFEIYKEE